MSKSTNEKQIGSEFKQNLIAKAKESLVKTNRNYVTAFERSTVEGKDPETILAETQRYLQSGHGLSKTWCELLEATLDLELAMDKVRRALWFLEVMPPGIAERWNVGGWTIYHVDFWTFEMAALLNRLEKLIKQTCRKLLKPSNPNWRKTEDTLMASVHKMQEDIGKFRNPLAHGGGPVEALALEQLWEPFVLTGVDFEEVVNRHYQSMAGFRQVWHDRLETVTTTTLAATNAILQELDKYAFPLAGGTT